jgi:pimeloyl-ACP methyl ester carboxylesterase
LTFTHVLALTGYAEETSSPWSANPERVKKLSAKSDQFNYDESKVPDYELPNPLVSQDGTQVQDSETWRASRREELLDLFRDYVYGHRPEIEASIRYTTTAEYKDAFDGAATGQSITATITIGERSYAFPFTLFIPNNANTPVPAVVHINNRYFISLETAMSKNDPFWPAKTLIERGYATASFYTSDVDPDRNDGYADGIRSFFVNGQSPEDTAWRCVSSWGWGASQILDHFISLAAVDGSKVAVVGHSRGGKASLWAACEDPRFAIAYSNNSGCGGAALSRRAYGETVAKITTTFWRWFCKPFSEYGGRENELPIDQHEMIALIAPRGVYVASSDEDLWADPKGEYASLVAAAPVFQLLGKESITDSEMPPPDQPRTTGQTGYHVRTGGHGLGEVDWNWFLNFSDGLLK